MKKYTKPQMLAKNAPTGSYAAGCPAKGTGGIGVQAVLSGIQLAITASVQNSYLSNVTG